MKFQKSIIILVLLAVTASLSAREITLNWLGTKRNIRTTYGPSKRVQFDKTFIATVEKGNIQKEAELELSEFLTEIIRDNLKLAPDNSQKAAGIIKDKFNEKKYFYYAASDIAFHQTKENPHVIAFFIKGLAELFLNDTPLNIKTFNVVFQSIKAPYVTDTFTGPIRYGSEVIVVEIIAYMRKYLQMVNEQKIEFNIEQDQIIRQIYEDLSLEKSHFINLEGAKELTIEF